MGSHSGRFTPEAWNSGWQALGRGESVPIWAELLLDAHASLPNPRSVVAAFSALEVLINEHVERKAIEAGKKDAFWTWLTSPDDSRERPPVSELFDNILLYVDGRSMKTDNPQLWAKYRSLYRARNKLVHEGRDPELTASQVQGHVATAQAVVDWVNRKEPTTTEAAALVLSIEPLNNSDSDHPDLSSQPSGD